jgi:hypothetical protein
MIRGTYCLASGLTSWDLMAGCGQLVTQLDLPILFFPLQSVESSQPAKKIKNYVIFAPRVIPSGKANTIEDLEMRRKTVVDSELKRKIVSFWGVG